MSFRQTGNKIAVTGQELIAYVKQQLANYDGSISKNKSLPKSNPYTHPIIYKTQNGKMIQVPEEIQKQAISSWYQQNGTNVPAAQQTAEIDPLMENEMRQEQKVVYVEDNSTNWLKLAMLILAGLLAVYLLYKMSTPANYGYAVPVTGLSVGPAPPTAASLMTNEQIRYYLTR